jgi:methionyl-tRNA synthetase
MEKKRFYITTPIYYVNDEPHIGHTYTTVLADVMTRYHRLLGIESWFLTGTDEHGQKVQQAAEKRGVEAQVHCDEYVQRFQKMWQEMDITNDDFIRTTEPRHKTIVQKLLQQLYDQGDIYQAHYDGLYSVSEERFITQKEYEEGNFREVKKISESNYFFRMGKYQQPLIDYIKSHPEFIQPENRRNEILGFLNQELGDLCISRPKSRLSWGVELPFDSEYVTYVWFDALTNYISAIGWGSDVERFEKWWPAIHLIGKDILTTHAVYWPTMLMAAGIPLPKTIFAHGWWTSEGQKMSKSLGNFIDLKTIHGHFDAVGKDVFRYYLTKEGPLTGDSDFSRERFYRTYNSELANDFGNLINRIFTLIHKYFDGKLPTLGEKDEMTLALEQTGEALIEKLPLFLEKFELGELLFAVITYVRSINRYMEQKAPWKLAKSDLPATATVLLSALNSLRLAGVLLSPVMPDKMGEFLKLVGADPEFPEFLKWNGLAEGYELPQTKALFPRYEEKTEAKAPASPAADQAKPEKEGLIDISQFQQVQMRVAKVLSVEKVPNADRLLKLQIDLGDEKRQIVAGIAQHYAPETLIDTKIIVVANLKPAKIRGLESYGMLLTAQKGKSLTLLRPETDIEPGAMIK